VLNREPIQTQTWFTDSFCSNTLAYMLELFKDQPASETTVKPGQD